MRLLLNEAGFAIQSCFGAQDVADQALKSREPRTDLDHALETTGCNGHTLNIGLGYGLGNQANLSLVCPFSDLPALPLWPFLLALFFLFPRPNLGRDCGEGDSLLSSACKSFA